MSVRRIVGAGLFACLALAPFSLAFAQTVEDDNPNDRRNWGYSSRFNAQVQALGDTAVTAFPIPVLLGVEVANLTKNFGDSRGAGTRTHEGLDILAPQGTPVASPTEAVVTRTGNGANSGLYIRTANPGDETFVYMHLSAIAQGIEAGDTVKRGEIIGFVGNTGNASGGPAHLHFEIRRNGATDPYPRLTQVFTQAEREQSIADAQAKGILISQSVLAQLASGTVSAPPVLVTTPAHKAILVFGEKNADVISLQKFLIVSPQGSAGERLKNTGPTGYFGPLTRDALIEYQLSAGLNASGIVDDATYTQIFALQGEGDSSEAMENGEGTTDGNAVSFTFTRDLEVGMTGADVRELQKFLNTKGFFVASSGAGSLGNESDYFGSLTRAALAKYQAANGISPAVGYLGPITRGRIIASI